MKDKDFLQWIHDRLERVHRENRHMDYMCKLRSIIYATDPKQETPNTAVDYCEIRASEIKFKMFVSSTEIASKAKDIWKHPSKYSDYKDNSDSAYYGFLKFLWIKFPDGNEEQLARFVSALT